MNRVKVYLRTSIWENGACYDYGYLYRGTPMSLDGWVNINFSHFTRMIHIDNFYPSWLRVFKRAALSYLFPQCACGKKASMLLKYQPKALVRHKEMLEAHRWGLCQNCCQEAVETARKLGDHFMLYEDWV